jgi:predicted P-loop ATPase
MKRKVIIPDGTDLNSTAQPKAKLHGQILTCISDHYNLFRNEVTMDLELNGKPLSEHDYNSLFIEVMDKLPNGKGFSKVAFDVVMHSNFIPSYNPIASFFQEHSLPDEVTTGNIDKLVESLHLVHNAEIKSRAGMEPQGFVSIILKKWLVGMVASVYDTNYNVLMPVLIGPKGCGKTEFWRRLLPDPLKRYFTQCKFNNGKDDEALMCENLMVLNDELDGLHAKEARTFRNFISANHYTYRPPYGKRNIKRKRLASVCGASNDAGVILDPENNRRIVPIEIFSVNRDLYNSIDKTALIMEAHKLFRQGFDWNLSRAEIDLLDTFSKGYEVVTIETELIQRYYMKGTIQYTATEIMGQLQEKAPQYRLKVTNIGKALRFLGFVPEKKKINGYVQQVYGVTPLFNQPELHTL